ncbi:unnamed protein product [marine sediment metagenome]|uniref:Thioredoxin domain-containing protein n=1 Tax=marine sediment metagenome TaxID=412755 RepID=X0TND5_9ZZZZ
MASDKLVQLTDDNFQEKVVQSPVPVMVDFWAEWCMPCKMVAPIIEQLAADYEGRAVVGSIDTDANRNTAVKYGISAIPTVMVFKGGELVKRLVGVQPKKDYAAALDEALG